MTEKQLEVLRWINEGCPDGVMNEYVRISAATLRRRDLAKVSGHGASWRAVITAKGKEHLKAADGPNPPIPRQENGSVTEQLVRKVIAAGGSLRVPQKAYFDRDGVDYRRRAALARQHGKVPEGKRLDIESISPEELELRLVDDPTWAPLVPVPVPGKVVRYHPLVRRFKEARDRHEVSRAALPRALRILQGLVVEAERRGHDVAVVSIEKSIRRQEGWSGPKHGHIEITADGHTSAIRVFEEGLPSRVHWENQNREYDRFVGDWRLPPLTKYEEQATGHLNLELVTGWGGGGTKWGDRKSWTLEEKLPEVLRAVEQRAAEARERERQAQQAAGRRRREWEAAMEGAKERYLEDCSN